MQQVKIDKAEFDRLKKIEKESVGLADKVEELETIILAYENTNEEMRCDLSDAEADKVAMGQEIEARNNTIVKLRHTLNKIPKIARRLYGADM